MKTFEGVDIKEVWDFRLSSAVPLINNKGKTWIVEIWSKENPDYVEGGKQAEPLETFDTGIETVPGDAWNTDNVKKCYEWLLTVRDKYALPDIEKLKPLVAKINQANEALAIALSA